MATFARDNSWGITQCCTALIEPEMTASAVYLCMCSSLQHLQRNSEPTSLFSGLPAVLMASRAPVYCLDFVISAEIDAAPVASFSRFSSVFPATDRSLDCEWRYVQQKAIRLHPIRAETLFTNSACLRRQIFIPYAPISRSVGYGASRPQSCRRPVKTLVQLKGATLGDAVLPNRPLGEFGAHTRRRERDDDVDVRAKRRVRGILRNLDTQVIGVESIHSGNQHNHYLGDTT